MGLQLASRVVPLWRPRPQSHLLLGLTPLIMMNTYPGDTSSWRLDFRGRLGIHCACKLLLHVLLCLAILRIMPRLARMFYEPINVALGLLKVLYGNSS